MEEIIKYLIGLLILVAGYFLGIGLRNITLDEQKQGRIYFEILTIISVLLSFVGLILRKDWMLFTFAFIAVLTAPSLKEIKK